MNKEKNFFLNSLLTNRIISENLDFILLLASAIVKTSQDLKTTCNIDKFEKEICFGDRTE